MLAKAKNLVSKWPGLIKHTKNCNRQMSESSKEQTLKFDIGSKKEPIIDAQTEANKVYGFFSTVKGQKLVGGVWLTASAVAALYHVAPNWFFLDKIEAIYQSYSKGFPTKVNNDMLNIINEVTQDFQLSEQQVKTLGLFVLSLTEPYGWGELGRNALIGFPEYFYWVNIEEVPIDKMRFGTNLDSGSNCMLSPSQLDSDAAKSFCSSMILSDNAKKFAIAREVNRTIAQPFLIQGVISFSFTLLTYNISRIVNQRLGLFKRPPLIRGIMYVSLLPSMILSYFVIKDAYSCFIDKQLDKKAAQINSDYAAGGVEYYDKMMQRNRALRELNGESGRAMYTGKGDIVHGIVRVKTASIQERRDICANLV